MTKTVLIADDNDSVRKVIRAFVRSAGYETLDVACAEEAIAVERDRGPVDVLITDLVMPDLDGFDLAAALTQRNPSLKVLYVSGYADMRWTGSFLAKPFTASALTEALLTLTSAPL